MKAIELLTRQHTEVAKALQRARTVTGDEQVRLLGEVAEALTIHAAIEEQYLYPVFRRYALPEAADESIHEHQEVRELVGAMMDCPQNDPRLNDILNRLDAAIREHVGKEEGDLFPWIRARVPDDEIDEIGEQMQRLADQLRQREMLSFARQRQSPLHP